MTRNEIFSVLQSNLRARIGELRGRTILETNGLRELGANSLEIMEVITVSMEQLKIAVPREQLLQTRDLAGVLDLFERAAGR